MKYVLNAGERAFSFTYNVGVKEAKIIFDKKRIYRDTGNIATTGITIVDDKVFETLMKENEPFKQYVEKGVLVLTDKKALAPIDKVADLERENAELRAKLSDNKAEKEKEKIEEEKAKLAEENASLKAQLEALAKKDTKSEDKKDTKSEDKTDEGF